MAIKKTKINNVKQHLIITEVSQVGMLSNCITQQGYQE